MALVSSKFASHVIVFATIISPRTMENDVYDKMDSQFLTPRMDLS